MVAESIPYADSLTSEQLAALTVLSQDDLTLDERFAVYGRKLGAGAWGGNAATRARRYLDGRIAELRTLLCNDLELGKLSRSAETGVALTLATAIAGKLVSKAFVDVDVLMLSILIAQAGLLHICPEGC